MLVVHSDAIGAAGHAHQLRNALALAGVPVGVGAGVRIGVGTLTPACSKADGRCTGQAARRTALRDHPTDLTASVGRVENATAPLVSRPVLASVRAAPGRDTTSNANRRGESMSGDEDVCDFRIIYASGATSAFDEDQLPELLRAARRNNAELSVTGMLLYDAGCFLQVLEGSEPDVRRLYVRISRDPRHDNVRLLLQSVATQRDFGEWTMGLARLPGSELRQLKGLNSVLRTGLPPGELERSAALRVVDAFRQGRWRQRVEAS